ncbi:MAG: hypothetical protein KIG60_01840, partial [Caryophanon sp.]|nr:hypothetical protein [Caryophanon sp.]
IQSLTKTETARIINAHTEYAGALSPVARAVTEDFNSSAPTRSISIETIKASIKFVKKLARKQRK